MEFKRMTKKIVEEVNNVAYYAEKLGMSKGSVDLLLDAAAEMYEKLLDDDDHE